MCYTYLLKTLSFLLIISLCWGIFLSWYQIHIHLNFLHVSFMILSLHIPFVFFPNILVWKYSDINKVGRIYSRHPNYTSYIIFFFHCMISFLSVYLYPSINPSYFDMTFHVTYAIVIFTLTLEYYSMGIVI